MKSSGHMEQPSFAWPETDLLIIERRNDILCPFLLNKHNLDNNSGVSAYEMTSRDFSSNRDHSSLYICSGGARREITGDYNIRSGRSHSFDAHLHSRLFPDVELAAQAIGGRFIL